MGDEEGHIRKPYNQKHLNWKMKDKGKGGIFKVCNTGCGPSIIIKRIFIYYTYMFVCVWISEYMFITIIVLNKFIIISKAIY